MKNRRGGKKASKPSRLKRAQAAAQQAESRPAEHSSHILLDVFLGLLITTLFSSINWGLEKTAIGEQLREATYDVLQLRLTSKFDPNKLDVAVVDVSTMPYERAVSHDYDYTKRELLKTLVQQIAAQQPRGIGVDIDFTPFPDQASADQDFLRACLQLSQGAAPGKPIVPIFVAAFHSLLLGPSLALYDSEYEPLAAFDGLPLAAGNETPKRMIDTVDVRYKDENDKVQDWPLRSLAAATTGITVKPPPEWAAWAFDRQTTVHNDAFTANEFYVDYGPLDELVQQTVPWDDKKIQQPSLVLYQKYVFVGRAQASAAASDQHSVPGHRAAPFAGVYIHACAAYTLLHGPLQKLTLKGRYVLDLLLSLAILVPVALLRWRYRATEPLGGIAHHRVGNLLTLVIVVIAIAAGVYAVNVHHLMWDDSLFVAAGLLIHRSVERHLIGIAIMGRRLFTLAWVLLLFKEDEDAYRPLDNGKGGN
jgi:CHASE2 domain-containing sensor protein